MNYNYGIKFKAGIGDLVGHSKSGQICTVIRRWSKVTKLSDENYQFVLSYTVQPEKGQRFKVPEDELELLE